MCGARPPRAGRGRHSQQLTRRSPVKRRSGPGAPGTALLIVSIESGAAMAQQRHRSNYHSEGGGPDTQIDGYVSDVTADAVCPVAAGHRSRISTFFGQRPPGRQAAGRLRSVSKSSRARVRKLTRPYEATAARQPDGCTPRRGRPRRESHARAQVNAARRRCRRSSNPQCCRAEHRLADDGKSGKIVEQNVLYRARCGRAGELNALARWEWGGRRR